MPTNWLFISACAPVTLSWPTRNPSAGASLMLPCRPRWYNWPCARPSLTGCRQFKVLSDYYLCPAPVAGRGCPKSPFWVLDPAKRGQKPKLPPPVLLGKEISQIPLGWFWFLLKGRNKEDEEDFACCDCHD